MRVLYCFFWLCVLSATGFSIEWKSEIERLYKRSELGAELKFVDGLLVNRAPDYKVFGPTGSQMDLSLERERFEQLFSLATRVQFTTKIETVVANRDGADATVLQTLQVELVDYQTSQLYTKVMTTRSVDRWVMIGGTPRVATSKVSFQYFSRGPRLKDDTDWQIISRPKPGKPE